MLLFAVAATMFAACSKDATTDIESAMPIDKFYATIADDASRVQLGEGCKTVWTAGDKVSLFNKKSGNECWQFGGATGDTVGELTQMDSQFGTSLEKVVAIYPYNADQTASDSYVNIIIPNVQKYAKDSFGEGGNIMLATSRDHNLSFKHIFGWLKLQLTGDYVVKSIFVYGGNNETFAGNAVIANDFSDYVVMGSKGITLDCGEGVQLTSKPTNFYIAVVPQTFAKGLHFLVETDGGSYSKDISHSISVERNHIVPIKTLDKRTASAITYTTSDGKAIGVNINRFDAEILSHTYDNGIGEIAFDGEITSIANGAFSDCTTLTGITLPTGITDVGGAAFADCTSLTSISLPDGVASIGDFTFSKCTSLTSITLPDSVTSIGDAVFSGCTALTGFDSKFATTDKRCLIVDGELKGFAPAGITSYVLPGRVVSIGYAVFSGCTELTDIVLPAYLKNIGGSAFSGCTALTGMTIPPSVTSIGGQAFRNCTSLTSITIPKSVTDLGDYICYGCTGKAYVDCNIPDITRKDNYIYGPFLGSNFTEVVIGEGVQSIGTYAFFNCTTLQSVTIPKSAAYIGDFAFANATGKAYINCNIADMTVKNNSYCGPFLVSKFSEIVIGEGVQSIGIGAFYKCSTTTSITIPSSVTSIGYSAFYGCAGKAYINCDIADATIQDGYLYAPFFGSKFADVIIGNTVRSIGDYAFYGCSAMNNITISDSVASIGAYAFKNCTGLASLTLPKSITSLGRYVADGCTGTLYVNCNVPDCTYSTSTSVMGPFVSAKFSKIVVGDGVKTLGMGAFLSCQSLTDITIADSVTLIGDAALQSCTNLQAIYCKPATPPTLGDSVFYDTPTDAKIYVPAASADRYRTASGWSSYSAMITGYNF